MGSHLEDFLLSVLCLAISDWPSKYKSFLKHKNRENSAFVDEIYAYCKNFVKSSYDFIESEEDAIENNHGANDFNNKKKIKGLFRFCYIIMCRKLHMSNIFQYFF